MVMLTASDPPPPHPPSKEKRKTQKVRRGEGGGAGVPGELNAKNETEGRSPILYRDTVLGNWNSSRPLKIVEIETRDSSGRERLTHTDKIHLKP